MNINLLKKILLGVCIGLGLFMTTSCSNLVHELIVLNAPEINLEIEVTSSGVVIPCGFNGEKKYEKDSSDWSQIYGIYVWRAKDSPYATYELIFRHLNSATQSTYTGKSYDGTSIPYDFRINTSSSNMCSDGVPYKADGGSYSYFTDPEGINGKYFYRITKATLKYTYVKDDKGNASWSYRITDETSGWACSVEGEY